MSAKVENLRPVRSKEEARERGRNGGIASGQARRKKRDLRIALLALMDNEVDGQTGAERLAMALFKKALAGDMKAIEFVQSLVIAGNNEEQREELGLPDPFFADF